MEPPHGIAETPSSTATEDRSSLHGRERSSLVKNRMRETCFVRVCEGWGWQHPHLLGRANVKDDVGEADHIIRNAVFLYS